MFTDSEAPEIDEAQYDTGRGPCLDAFRTGHVYRIDSTADDERLPDFARDAAAHGITATLSVVARGETLGALNLSTPVRPPSMTPPRPGSRPSRPTPPWCSPMPRCTQTPASSTRT